jgi:hypothetical protein
MKLIDNILYLTFSEMLDCGVLEDTLKKAKNRKSPSWSFIDDPEDKRRVLIEYEKLGVSYKEKIKARFGNPYSYVAQQPIKNMVKWDAKAESFYLDYIYNGNKKLPKDHVDKYTKAASWLNMLKEATEDKRTLKNLLKLSIDQFYLHVMELIKTEKVDLPTSYRRLLAQRKKYEEAGYASLIDWRFGNNLAAKIIDDLSESTLLEMISHHNQYDDVFVCQQYNIWAQANGYKTIDAATVGVHRRKNDPNIIMYREGNAALNEKYIKQVKGRRPSAPLFMVESDDNHLDLYFIDIEDPTAGKYFHKYKAIVVVDSFNDYVLGYAYSENLSTALVKTAYLNAMYHIRSITGGWYLPHETKTDKWAHKELVPFYKTLGNYIPAALGNKHRGYIEQFFGNPHWKRCLKAGAINYSGNNITAKNRGVNQEVLSQNKKNYPILGNESVDQVEQFFYRLRHMPQSNGVSKHDQWLESWNNLPNEDKRSISDEQFLLKFGIKHSYRGKDTIEITNRGVEPQINNIQYSYDLQEYHLNHIGKSVHLLYDPYDMSRVLVTDFENIRLMGYEPRLQARALHDAQLDSRTYLNILLEEKREQVDGIAAAGDRRKKVLEHNSIDAEAVLQAGVVVKELKQSAEQKMLGAMINNKTDDDFDVFDQM